MKVRGTEEGPFLRLQSLGQCEGTHPSCRRRDPRVVCKAREGARGLTAGAGHDRPPNQIGGSVPKKNRGLQRIFVGRAAELEKLSAALTTVVEHKTPALILVAGELGIGKSLLLQRFTELAPQQIPSVVLWGRCREGDGAPAYWPWIQIFQRLEMSELLSVVTPEMAAPVRVLIHATERTGAGETSARSTLDSERVRFFDGLRAALAAIAQAHPLVLVFDDLHRADESSLRLLAFVAQELEDVPVLLVAAYRNADVPPNPVFGEFLSGRYPARENIRLLGLSNDEVLQYINASGLTTSPGLVARILSRTAGNPFFVKEVVADMRLLDADRPHASVPPTLREAIVERLRYLEPTTIEVLRSAAVIGREVSRRVLAMVEARHGRTAEQVLHALDEAVAGGLVRPDDDDPDKLQFIHVLIQEAIHDELPTAKCGVLHRDVAESIAEPIRQEQIASVAHHLERAHHFGVPGVAGRALDATRQAAHQCATRLAYGEAIQHFKVGLLLLGSGAVEGSESALALQHGELLVGLAQNQALSGAIAAAQANLLEAFALAKKIPAPQLLIKVGLARAIFGDISIAGDLDFRRLLEECLTVAGVEPAAQALLGGRLGAELYHDAPQRQRCIALCREAVAKAEACGDPAVLASVLGDLHFVLTGPDSLAERTTLAAGITRLGETQGIPRRRLDGLLWSGLNALEHGDPDPLDAALASGASIAAQLRQPFYDWRLATLNSTRATLRGNFADAEAYREAAVAAGESAQSTNAPLVAAVQLCQLKRDQGGLATLRPMVDMFLDQFPGMLGVRYVAVSIYAEIGDMVAARSLLDRLAVARFKDLARDGNWLGSLCRVADVCVDLGDRQRAQWLYALLRPYADRVAVFSFGEACDGAVARCLGRLAGLLGKNRVAREYFEQAMHVNSRLQAVPWIAHTQRDHAAALLAAELASPSPTRVNLDKARTLLDAATATYAHLHMPTYTEKAESLRRQLEEALARRRRNVLRFDGKRWELVFEGRSLRMRKALFAHYLQLLLGSPGRWFSAVEIQAAYTAGAVSTENSLHDVSNEPNLQAARPGLGSRSRGKLPRLVDELRSLREQRAEAEASNDVGALARIDEQMLRVRELLDDPEIRSDIEKAAAAVAAAITRAKAAIRKVDVELSRHLSERIRRKGNGFSYDGRGTARWEVCHA